MWPREWVTADKYFSNIHVLCPLSGLLCSFWSHWLQKPHRPNSVLPSNHFLPCWDGDDASFAHCDVLASGWTTFLYLISRILNRCESWSVSPHFASGCLSTFVAAGNMDLFLCCYSSSASWLLVVCLCWSLYMLILASHSWFWDSCLCPTGNNTFQVLIILFSQLSKSTGGLIMQEIRFRGFRQCAQGSQQRAKFESTSACYKSPHSLFNATRTPLISEPSESWLASGHSSPQLNRGRFNASFASPNPDLLLLLFWLMDMLQLLPTSVCICKCFISM